MGGHTAKTTHRVVDAESGTHIELITVPLSKYLGTSLVAQWLRILLPVQGTWVQPLVRKIPRAKKKLNPGGTTMEPTV